MGTRIGFVASEKGAAKECDVGLGLRMQTNSNDNKSFNRNKMMMMMRMMPHHHDNENDDDGDDERHRGFGEEGCGLSGCGSGGGTSTISDRENDNGPSLFCNTSNHHNNINSQVASMSDIYDVVGSASGSLLPKTLLLHNSEPFSYNSSGVMVNANVRVPFTVAQRQELERQTMIYKHMMASAPVPPQLLLPFTKTPSNFAHLSSNRISLCFFTYVFSSFFCFKYTRGKKKIKNHYCLEINIVNQLGLVLFLFFVLRVKGSLELGISNTSDQEPWRCRRTDGKKWRCSRNVIPDQKYCERHSHKSRPRSRKHVELHSHFLNNTNHSNDNTRIPYSKPDFLDQRRNHQSPFSTNLVSSSSATSHDQPGSMEWFMNSNQEWQQIMHIKQNESNTNVDMPKEANDRALILHSNQGLQQSQGLNDQFSLLIDPKLTPLGGAAMDSHQSNQTRHFIDAWSMAERDRTSEIGHSRYSVNSNNKLTFSSLALSIHGGNEASEESQNAQMGFGRESEGDVKSQWMMNPVSWSGSPPPGGPLAEALCLGMAGSTRPPASRSSS